MLAVDQDSAGEAEGEEAGGLLVSESSQRASSAEGGTCLVGTPFIGTVTSIEGRVSGLTVSVVLGTSIGEIVGSITIDGRRGRDGHRYQFKGAVNSRGLFVWHGSTEAGRRAVFTGNVGAGGDTLSGKYMSQEPGSALEVGAFMASRS